MSSFVADAMLWLVVLFAIHLLFALLLGRIYLFCILVLLLLLFVLDIIAILTLGVHWLMNVILRAMMLFVVLVFSFFFLFLYISFLPKFRSTFV